MLTGCLDSDSSSPTGSTGSESTPVASIKTNKTPASVTKANAGAISTVAVEAVTGLDSVFDITDIDGFVNLNSKSNQVQTAATKTSCSAGGSVNYTEIGDFSNQNGSFKASYNSCKESSSTLNGELYAEMSEKEEGSKKTYKSFFKARDFSFANNLVSISIDGSLEDYYVEYDLARKDESYIFVNKFTVKVNGDFEGYAYSGYNFLNGRVDSSCEYSYPEWKEVCKGRSNFLEVKKDDDWFVMSDINIAVTEVGNLDSSVMNSPYVYVQNGSYDINSNKFKDGQLTIELKNLKFEEVYYSSKGSWLNEPVSGVFTVSGKNQSKVTFELESKNKAKLSITGENGSTICNNLEVDLSDLENINTLVANCN